MFAGHDPYLVALSVVIAILGGYTGFGLAARIRGTPGVSRRVLLAGAAGFLAVGIWTMHFVGMLAAPIPPDAVYLVLPTIISFLICTLVVGIAGSRLTRAGLISVAKVSRLLEPEFQLYRLLRQQGGDAYSRYNALQRELVSFESALDLRCRQ